MEWRCLSSLVMAGDLARCQDAKYESAKTSSIGVKEEIEEAGLFMK